MFTIQRCWILLVFFYFAFDMNGQNDTVKVMGTLFAKKMVDAGYHQGNKDQILVSDSLGFLYFRDSAINFPVPIELDSVEQLDSLVHKTGLVAVVKNNGSFISDGFTWLRVSCNIRLSNIRQLRNLKRQPCPVFVQSYYDSLHYGGGNFHWVGYDQLGNGDDGGNIFAAKDTGYWVRDKVTFIPSNYGAVDSSDQKYSDFKTSSDALQRCVNAAGKSGAIEFDNGFVYNNGGTLILKDGQILDGRNATLFRVNRIKSTITSHSANSNEIFVADSMLFEVGMSVVAKLGSDYSYSYPIVAKIGSKLVLYASMSLLNNQVVSFSGAEILTSCYQVRAVQPNIRIDNLILNGNKDGNIMDNRWENSGELYLQSENGKFMNLAIKNSIGESINLFGTNPLLRNTTINNGNGNGIHLGSNDRYTIDNVSIINVNILARLGDFTLGHEGGGITHSDDVHGGLVQNVYVEQALGVITGISSDDDSENYYDKISGKNCIKAIEIKQCFGASGLSDIQLTNSKFLNCGILEISSNNQTLPVDFVHNIKLRNVELTNTSLTISNAFSISVDDLFFKDSSINTNLTFYNLENCVLRNIIVQGGRYLNFASMNNVVLSNFNISNTFGNCAIHALYSDGDFLIENGKITHTECVNGYRGIFAGSKSVIDKVTIRLSGTGAPNSGIELYTSSSPRAGIVRNCNISTPTGIPSIKAFAGTQNNYIINNIINQPIQDNGTNFQIGTILIDE